MSVDRGNSRIDAGPINPERQQAVECEAQVGRGKDDQCDRETIYETPAAVPNHLFSAGLFPIPRVRDSEIRLERKFLSRAMKRIRRTAQRRTT